MTRSEEIASQISHMVSLWMPGPQSPYLEVVAILDAYRAEIETNLGILHSEAEAKITRMGNQAREMGEKIGKLQKENRQYFDMVARCRNSVVEVMIEFPNVDAYIKQLERVSATEAATGASPDKTQT